MTLLIRDSLPSDIPSITAIYGHAVLHGNASFELVPPDATEIARRRDAVLEGGYPHLVAEQGGTVVGYSHAGPYRVRPAYRFTVENSVYVSPAHQGLGVGLALLPPLIERCEHLGYRLMIAVIGNSANHASIRLHARCGFAHAGLLPAIGWKHGRWLELGADDPRAWPWRERAGDARSLKSRPTQRPRLTDSAGGCR